VILASSKRLITALFSSSQAQRNDSIGLLKEEGSHQCAGPRETIRSFHMTRPTASAPSFESAQAFETR
jgi:hypothetical protein